MKSFVKVWKVCKKNHKFFWAQVTKETIENMIDKGIMFCRAYDKSVAIQGRKYTKRKKDW